MWQSVEKPVHRGKWRKFFGKEYFILKRKWHWLNNKRSFARKRMHSGLEHEYMKHQSMLLRPLKDVDMILQHNKVKNLELAIGHMNGIVIRPGETFSIWKLVGRPTKSKGYLDGLTLENGQIGRGVGGGLCQLGNLLYWMALHSPLEITERWRHGFDVFPDINRSIPFACGATLSYNYVDLQLTNSTQQDFVIELWLDKSHLNGRLTSNLPSDCTYQVIETDHQIQQQWWGGYTRHNRIWKESTHKDSGEQKMDLVTENNAIMMYNPLLESYVQETEITLR